MRTDNRGFTLVELMVGIVIFGVISAAALGFLVASSRTYGSVSGAMNQRMDAQLAMNQITEYIIDCNEGVCFSDLDSALYVLSTQGDGAVEARVFKCDDGRIDFGAGNATISESAFFCDVLPDALLLDKVTDFEVSIRGGSNADYVIIRITTENRGEELLLESTVALRNKPKILTKN